MVSRDDALNFLRSYGFELTMGATAFITLVYAFQIDYSLATDLVIGKFVGIVLNAVSAAASLVAFSAVFAATASKWGDMQELRTYIGVGSLIGLIASSVMLAQTFNGA